MPSTHLVAGGFLAQFHDLFIPGCGRGGGCGGGGGRRAVRRPAAVCGVSGAREVTIDVSVVGKRPELELVFRVQRRPVGRQRQVYDCVRSPSTSLFNRVCGGLCSRVTWPGRLTRRTAVRDWQPTWQAKLHYTLTGTYRINRHIDTTRFDTYIYNEARCSRRSFRLDKK